jgi:hypothetical protein
LRIKERLLNCSHHLTLVYLKYFCSQEEQAAKLKAEKIRVALEKIKEAQVKKVISLGFLLVLWIYKELSCLYNVPLI